MVKIRNKSGIVITLMILIIQMFLLVNVDILFGTSAETIKWFIIVHMVMIASVSSLFQIGAPKEELQLPNLMWFVILFFITSFMMMLVPAIQGISASLFPVVTMISYGLLYSIAMAYPEEYIFRWALPDIINKQDKVGSGDIIASILFGLFHASFLFTMSGMSGAILGMIFLAMLGLLWCYVRKAKVFGQKIGILGSLGSHFAYNLFVMGLTAHVLGVI